MQCSTSLPSCHLRVAPGDVQRVVDQRTIQLAKPPTGPDPMNDDEDDARSEMEETNIRYGRIPQPRGHKTTMCVELFHGNYVLDQLVSKKLLATRVNHSEREFTHMRYLTATCNPNDLKDSGSTPCQVRSDPPPRTELFILMAMSNEEEEPSCLMTHGVVKNVARLCKRGRSKAWEADR